MSWEVLPPTSSPCGGQEKSHHRELDSGDTVAHKMYPLGYYILISHNISFSQPWKVVILSNIEEIEPISV